ncbi:rab-like protein 3 isoform X2 [Trachypithecus francoisi]|uniref:rab-like protein 3 isoform X2 n=1 Tax=Trachypithecus francoisi TaxID=54180 RepID=UPI00141B6CB2|nr:rab-like protein 3 isoform X2 [Trachypithecus francoisi]
MKLKALPSMLNSDWLTIPEQASIQGRQWQDGVPRSGEGTGVGRLRCWEIFISPSSMPKSSTGKSIMDCGLLSGCQSIIFVHDLTNKKSSQNLRRWSLEALNRDLVPTGVLVTNGDYDREQFADNQIPLLVIGTKLDQIHETKRHEVLTRTAFLAEDFNPEEINLDCTNPRYLAAGSSNAVKLSRFFDKVIEKRYFLREGNQIPGFPDRKRFGAGTLKSLHYD